TGEKSGMPWLAQYGAREPTLEGADAPKSELSKTSRRKLLGARDYVHAAFPAVRVATDAPVKLSTESDVLPLAAADPKRVAKLAERHGVGSSIGRLQKALDALPARGLFVPADLVGAVVVLERHGHLLVLAVDADIAGEAVALSHGRVLAVVALDVVGLLDAVAVGLVRQDLLHALLCLVHVELGGDEES